MLGPLPALSILAARRVNSSDYGAGSGQKRPERGGRENHRWSERMAEFPGSTLMYIRFYRSLTIHQALGKVLYLV